MTDEEWALWKAAVTEYSMYRPLLEYEAYVPTPDSISQVAPDGAYGLESIEWGTEFPIADVMAQPEGETGWCFSNGVLYLTPAPTDATPISLTWRIVHQPDELTRTFPTLPAEDLYIVQWLVDAATAEASTSAVEMGLSGYTIGGTSVKWAQTGGSGGPSSSSRAERLRNRALTALAGPMAEWG